MTDVNLASTLPQISPHAFSWRQGAEPAALLCTTIAGPSYLLHQLPFHYYTPHKHSKFCAEDTQIAHLCRLELPGQMLHPMPWQLDPAQYHIAKHVAWSHFQWPLLIT